MLIFTSNTYFTSSFILYSIFAVVNSVSIDNFKLEQLQVLFRHGDRTPDESSLFANDPYDKIYRKYGYAHLTEIGKQREYKIGQILRERYDDFLGEYQNNDVYAYSTDLDRTKMSLQLVLAGLYPPTPSNSWNKLVNWQPIPTRYDANEINFLTSSLVCPVYKELINEAGNTPEISKLLQKHQNLFKRIKNNTGINITKLFTASLVYSNFRSSLSLGLALPKWFTEQDYRELEKIATIGMKSFSSTEQLKRMVAGPTVEQFLKNFNDSSKKIYLYSAHEVNVAAIINSHNITGTPGFPDYGSTIIIEKLRGLDDLSYIRLLLWTGVTEQLMPLKIANCEETCLLSDYEKIVQVIVPNEASKVCTSSRTLCRRSLEQTRNIESIDFDLQIAQLFAGSDLASLKDFSSYAIERS